MPFDERTDWRDTPSAPPPPGSTPVHATDILRWERGLAVAHQQLDGRLSEEDLNATYAPVFPAAQTITYDGNGNVQTVTENGVTTTYTYNADGTVDTDTRQGVTRKYTYTNGNLTKIEVQ